MAEAGTGDGQGDLPQQYTDEAVQEFLKARLERILVRRARIGDKIARRNDAQTEGSEVSSLDFIAGGGDEPRPGTAASAASGGSAPGRKGSKGKVAAEGGVGGATGPELLNLQRVTADPLDVQIEESRKQLEQIILDGEALITNVRIAAENREKVRHVKLEETRKDRMERLQKEADECQAMYEDLKPNWNISGEKVLPMDLFEKIKAQMQASEELLMKKQDLIRDMQQEIEDNDFEYEQNLEIYQKDVSLLGDRIDDCVDDMQTAFLSELNLIEDYTCRNREVFLEENQREWMDLLGEFQTMEEAHLAERKKDALDKFKNLNELYITVKQECRAQRHRFEDDLRILIQELEQIKYATQLNMEKLQYNLAIVRKRYKENVEMKNMMKRLLLKFNDRFTTKSKALKQKMEAGKKEAKKILADIAKLEESLSLFGKKTLHLTMSDWAKYMDLWMVSEEMIRDRVKKLLDSERFVFETQLGYNDPIIPELTFMDDRPEQVTKWVEKKSLVYSELLGKKKRQSSTASATAETEQKQSKADLQGENNENKDTILKTAEQKEKECIKSASLLLLSSDSMDFLPGPDPDPAIQRRLMKHVAKVICDESGFLVEEELRKLLEPLIETERNLVNLDALLKALGINSVEEMQYLAHFMLRRCRVTKGVVSRIGSRESAHLTEMNVSLEGIVGKNAMDDLDSDGSDRSKSQTPVDLSDGKGTSSGKDEQLSHISSEFKECKCERPETKAKTKKREQTEEEEEEEEDEEEEAATPPPKLLGETSLEILLPPVSRGDGEDDDDDENGQCALIPELKGVDEQQLSFTDFKHSQTHCSPKCCSLGGSEETIEEAVVEVEDDDQLEEMLDEADEVDVERGPSKCSTCGGEPHDHKDCSFFSSEATVLSWVDPLDPPNKALRDALHKADSAEEEQPSTGGEEEEQLIPLTALPAQLVESTVTPDATAVVSEIPPSSGIPSTFSALDPDVAPDKKQQKERISLEEEGTQIPLELVPLPLPTLEDYGDPVRRYSEVMPLPATPGAEHAGTAGEIDKSTAQTTSQETSVPFGKTDSCESDSEDKESIKSLDSSSNGSEEFMYIEPDEVIEALTEFCKDYNARITVELPTLDELIDKKLAAFKYPKQNMVVEYWERPVKILTSNSDDMWDIMQFCFEQFGDALHKRNAMVDRFIYLYKQNRELGVLMKNHFTAARKYSSSRPNPNPMVMQYGRFCN